MHADHRLLAGEASGQLFLVGCARTGSTVLRSVLNRSDLVCLASETHFFRWAKRSGLSAKLDAVRSAADGVDDGLVDDVISRLYSPGFWPWLRRNVPPEVVHRRLSASSLTEQAIFSMLIELYRERGCRSGRDVIEGEKTPQHLYNVETFVEWFPGCRIIHTFRDPRGIFASQLRQLQRGRWGPKGALRRFLPERVADAILTPYQLAHTTWRWRDAVRLHRKYQALLGDRYTMVRFEDLVAQPEAEVRRMCHFLSVPFQPSMLEGVDMVGSGFHAERHIGAGLDASAAERWRSHVHPIVSTWFSLVFRGALREFGYSRD
jgi:omega-hydroxy-beta-dihydromenaquinone-9 sulfotransferase